MLVAFTTDSREGKRLTSITGPYGEQDLPDVHTSNGSVGLAPCSTHTGLQSVGAGAGQHFVDADDVVGMSADTEMETFFAGDFD